MQSPRAGRPGHSSTPKSLLQVIELLDDFFLSQMLSLRDDGLAADDYFADGRA